MGKGKPKGRSAPGPARRVAPGATRFARHFAPQAWSMAFIAAVKPDSE